MEALLEGMQRDAPRRLARGEERGLAQADIVAQVMEGDMQALGRDGSRSGRMAGEEGLGEARERRQRVAARHDAEEQPLRPAREHGTRVLGEVEGELHRMAAPLKATTPSLEQNGNFTQAATATPQPGAGTER